MKDSTTRKSLKLKRVILKKVYADNLGVMWEGSRPLNGSTSRTRHWVNQRVLPCLITLMVLLSFLTLGAYFLYPQTSPAMDIEWINKKSPSNPSAAVVEHIDRIRHADLSEDSFPEGHTSQKGCYLEFQTERDLLRPNSPHDYFGLVNPMNVSIAELFDLGVKTIVIDPGHGGRDPGAIGHSGLFEKDVTLDIARRLRDRLKKHRQYWTIMTRDDDVYVSLKRRAEFANQSGADLFISIHVNYIPNKPRMVIETYYFGAHSDEHTLRIAEKENQGSEYLMAEFKGMIKKISDKFKQQESKSLAMSIQENLIKNIRQQNGAALDGGIKSAPFVVLLGTDMPSILAEVTCISNQIEEKKLAKPEYREDIARYLEGGIIEYIKKSQKEPAKGGTSYAKKKGE